MTDSYAKTPAASTPEQGAPSLRRAGPDDAQALADIGCATFTETFGELYPPEDLAFFLDEAHTLERAAADLANPAKAVWLLEAGGRAVGYALAGPCDLPHPKVTEESGQIERIYILADYQGRGIGSWLLNEVLAWLEKDGQRTLWLGVWSENLAAQGFYARQGFRVVGSYIFPVGDTRDVEYIMRRG